MILKTTRVKTASEYGSLYSHVLLSHENEEIHTLYGYENDIVLMFDRAEKYNKTNAVRHVSISPEEKITREQAFELVEMYRQEFKANDHDFVLIEHKKQRADKEKADTHYHLLISEVNSRTGKVLESSHFKKRNEKIAREAELKFGHNLTLGRHNRAVYHQFLEEGKVELAAKIEHLTTCELPNSSYTTEQFQEAKRKGVSLSEIKEIVQDCYSRSDNYPALKQALLEKSLKIEQGTKTLIIKNDEGTELGSLQRLLKMKKNEFEKYITEGDKINEQATIEPTAETPAPEPKNNTEQQFNKDDLRAEQDSSRQHNDIDRDVDRTTRKVSRPNSKPIRQNRPDGTEDRRVRDIPQIINKDAQQSRSSQQRVNYQGEQDPQQRIIAYRLRQAIIQRENEEKIKQVRQNKITAYRLRNALKERELKPEPPPATKIFEKQEKEANLLKFMRVEPKNKKYIDPLIEKWKELKDEQKSLKLNHREILFDLTKSEYNNMKKYRELKDDIEKEKKRLEIEEPKGILSYFNGERKKWKSEYSEICKKFDDISKKRATSLEAYNDKVFSLEYKCIRQEKENKEKHQSNEIIIKQIDHIVSKLRAEDPVYTDVYNRGDKAALKKLIEDDYERRQVAEWDRLHPQPTYHPSYDDDEDDYQPRGPSM